jgi:hypothetical protein
LFKHIELEINTACDLACFGCDRFSDVTTAPNMTVEQVNKFLSESRELDWQWKRVRLLGGEPTLHPQFEQMLRAVVAAMPDTFVQVLTNGNGKARQYLTLCKELGVSLHAEAKEKGVQPAWFNNTRIAPIDRDPNVGELTPCAIFGGHGCGIGLTRHGYFLDGAGASVARVAGIDCGVRELRRVTLRNMLEQAKVLCRLCGHWNPPDGTVTKLVTETGQVTGPFWTEAIAGYRKHSLPVY